LVWSGAARLGKAGAARLSVASYGEAWQSEAGAAGRGVAKLN